MKKQKIIGIALASLGIILVLLPIFKVAYYDEIKERARKQVDIGTITAADLNNRITAGEKDLMVLDVRSQAEYANGHIPTAIHIPIELIEQDSIRLDKNKDYILFCGAVTCGASDIAARKLKDLGFPNLFVLEGGYPKWVESGYEIEAGACPFHAELTEKSFWEECLNLGIVIGAGLTDGINPCAIGMMLFLLGYLVIFAEQRGKILPIGITYVATVFTTYLIIGMILYKSVNSFLSNPVYLSLSAILKIIITEILIVAGILNIKDYFFPKEKPTLGIPEKVQPVLKKLVEKATFPATILLGILVTIFETPCSLPIYVGTLEVLGKQLNLGWKVFGFIGLYNLLFILPLLIILFLISKGVELVTLKEWEHRNRKLMKLTMGIGIILVSLFMLFL